MVKTKNPYDEVKRKRMMGLSHSAELKEVLELVRAKGNKYRDKTMKLLAAKDTARAELVAAQCVGWQCCIKKICSQLQITLKPED